jgi:hypothetical protein
MNEVQEHENELVGDRASLGAPALDLVSGTHKKGCSAFITGNAVCP